MKFFEARLEKINEIDERKNLRLNFMIFIFDQDLNVEKDLVSCLLKRPPRKKSRT